MHVLVCGGTGCRASASDSIVENLKQELENKGLQDEIQVVMTGCFGFCEKGPIVKVQPDNTFYVQVKPEDAKEIIGSVKEKASEFVEEASDKLDEISDVAKEKAKDLAEDAKESFTEAKAKAKEFADSAEDKLEDFAEEAKETYTEAKEKTKGFFQKLFGKK